MVRRIFPEMPLRFLALALLAGLSASLTATIAVTVAQAHEFSRGGLTIIHPWARPTIAGRPIAAVYFKIDNANAEPDRLVSVTTDLTDRAELHTTMAKGEIMQMRPLDAIVVPGKQEMKLEPGGAHIMLINIKRQLKEDDRFKLTLKFEHAGTIVVEVVVQIPRADGQNMH